MEPGLKLDGMWANEYGSRMILTVEHGIVRGIYRATEGDVGRYRLTGIVDQHPAAEGLTFGLIVSWRDLDSEEVGPCSKEAPSAHWVTSLTGQLHCIDGQDVLTTTFLLTKNTPPEARWEDTVVNTMVFRRIASAPPTGPTS